VSIVVSVTYVSRHPKQLGFEFFPLQAVKAKAVQA
jgi:hypothetical protein